MRISYTKLDFLLGDGAATLSRVVIYSMAIALPWVLSQGHGSQLGSCKRCASPEVQVACGGGVRGHPSRVMPLRHLDLKTHMSEEACVRIDWHLDS